MPSPSVPEPSRGDVVAVAEALTAALDVKNGYPPGHSRRVAELAVLSGAELGMPRGALDDLRLGAVLRDVGKLAVPEAILDKPGKLTEAEYEAVKAHATAGEEILAPVPFLGGVRTVVRHAHERWDGRGYPDGLEGEAIPIGARVVFVVDAFHAMTSDRPFRLAMAEHEALAELATCAGDQFDPAVVDVFVRLWRRRRPPRSGASPAAPRT